MSGSQPADKSDKRLSAEELAFQSQGEMPTSQNLGRPGGQNVPSSIEAFQKVLPERYQLVREIDGGGMGQVLLAIDRGPNLKNKDFVAIKRMLGPVMRDSAAVDKFLAEVTLARTLRHPNVVKMFHSENTPLGPYIVMEYIDGVDLGKYIQVHGSLSEGLALTCFRKLAAALDEGHRQGIIHRDLKPGNILIDKSGEPYLVDFGIAHRLSDSDKTGTGMGAGTLAYMSPEQLENRKPDARQDIYSLGATLFHAVEGRPPFKAESVPRLIAKIMSERAPKATKVSIQLAERIAQCLEKEPRLRPVTCLAVCQISPAAEATPTPSNQENASSKTEIPTASVVVPPVVKSSPQRSQTSKPAFDPLAVRGYVTLVGMAVLGVLVIIGLAVWQPWSGATPDDTGKIAQDTGVTSDVTGPQSDAPNHRDNAVPVESATPELDELFASGDPPPEVSIHREQAVPAESATLQPESLTNSIGMKFRLIQPGTFLMGSPTSEPDRSSDETQYEVTLSRAYYLGVYEVTQAEYEKVIGSNPSVSKGSRHPVENVSWDDAQEFIRRLNALSAEQSAGRTYRLPTEAEWEYACRAGSKTAYSFGEDAAILGRYGWFADNSSGKTHPVGEKQPNDWDLYDMHGNVWEWCEDCYETEYPSKAMLDPTGPITGSLRVYRGGSRSDGAANCRTAYRGRLDPSDRFDFRGFRVALSPAGIPK